MATGFRGNNAIKTDEERRVHGLLCSPGTIKRLVAQNRIRAADRINGSRVVAGPRPLSGLAGGPTYEFISRPCDTGVRQNNRLAVKCGDAGRVRPGNSVQPEGNGAFPYPHGIQLGVAVDGNSLAGSIRDARPICLSVPGQEVVIVGRRCSGVRHRGDIGDGHDTVLVRLDVPGHLGADIIVVLYEAQGSGGLRLARPLGDVDISIGVGIVGAKQCVNQIADQPHGAKLCALAFSNQFLLGLGAIRLNGISHRSRRVLCLNLNLRLRLSRLPLSGDGDAGTIHRRCGGDSVVTIRVSGKSRNRPVHAKGDLGYLVVMVGSDVKRKVLARRDRDARGGGGDGLPKAGDARIAKIDGYSRVCSLRGSALLLLGGGLRGRRRGLRSGSRLTLRRRSLLLLLR